MTTHTLVFEDFPSVAVARTLSPNGRAHWTAKKQARDHVGAVVAGRALEQRLPRMRGLVKMTPTLIYPQVRARDDDNMATGVIKATRDFLVRGGWLEADDVEHLHQERARIEVEPGRRALILTFEWERS